MATPKVFESEYRFCLILWEHEPIKSSALVELCADQLCWKPTTTDMVIKRLAERGILKNAPIRILGKLTNPGSDHGFALYFGMDEDIQIEEVSGAELGEQGGTIRIPIRILSD